MRSAFCKRAQALYFEAFNTPSRTPPQRHKHHPDTMTNLPLLTRKEVESHNTKSSCYVTVDNLKVYDVSSFLEEHPGGGDLIVDFAGKDVTEIMGDLVSHEHSEAAYEMLDELYLVGILATPEQEAKLLTRENRHDFKLERTPKTNSLSPLTSPETTRPISSWTSTNPC